MSLSILLIVYLFLFGLCVGSFLNVVIYRLPREKSLVSPGSSCPVCSNKIRFYDNIPLLSWLFLGGKCRNCGTKISARYFAVELLTGLLFVFLFVFYFMTDYRRLGFDGLSLSDKFFGEGGWLFYLIQILLLTTLVGASAIDLELYIIPISMCWFVTAAGLAGAGLSPFVIDYPVIHTYRLFPTASASAAAGATGALAGLGLSLVLLFCGLIKRSYPMEEQEGLEKDFNPAEGGYNDRWEVVKEIFFLLPIITGAFVGWFIYSSFDAADNWWIDFSQGAVMNGLFGSLWGYFIGCAVVWFTRIFGTLAFGKEAMGLGDVHLMGAAGSVIGPVMAVIAFFVAPFFGLAWGIGTMVFKKRHEIPYGPFLSLAVFAVIIFHDWFRHRIVEMMLLNY
jgi:leader peptidase (prepilin peptidase)/N-methyltransferase